MFGSAILDVIIGLVFVYLILSLICSAINEYVASLLNMRGKVLVNGIEILLRDVDLHDAILKHPLLASNFPHHDTLVKHGKEMQFWPWGTRWIYRLYTWAFSRKVREARYPSYISPRAFATAFLEKAGYVDRLLKEAEAKRQAQANPAAGPPPAPAGNAGGAPVADRGDATGTAAADESDATGPAPGATLSGTPGRTPDAPGPSPAAGPSPGAAPSPAPEPPPPPQLKSAPPAGGGEHLNVARPDAAPWWRGLLAVLGWRHRAPTAAEVEAEAQRVANAGDRLQQLLDTLERDAALDPTPFPALTTLSKVADVLAPDQKRKVVDEALLWRNDLQKMQTSVETWFNGSMDRVSGAYKRYTQHALFFIGLIVAFAVNADTLELWRRLSSDPKLREALATQAATSLPAVARLTAGDTTKRDTTGGAAAQDTSLRSLRAAKATYDSASAMLNRTTLDFGWSWEDAQRLGIATKLDSAAADSARLHRASQRYSDARTGLAATAPRADSVKLRREALRSVPRPVFAYVGPWHPHGPALFSKLLGLLLTTFALSLGAPFWFDMLNKVVNVRAAGRAPTTTPAPTPAEGADKDDEKK